MSANLNEVNGKVAFASRDESPWHRQGTVFTNDVTGREMLRLAGLDWDVCQASMLTTVKRKIASGWDGSTDSPVYTAQEEVVPVPNKKSIYRNDNGSVMGVVGEDYHIFQNSEMIDFFEGLVKGKQIRYETAGALGVGETVWVMARIPDLSFAINGDDINNYMLIRTGHIGNLNLAVYPTSIRVVCQNTMRAANAEFAANRKSKGKNNVNSGYRIRHTAKMADAVESVKEAYSSLLEDFAKTKELYEILAGRKVTGKEVKDYFQKILTAKSEEDTLAKSKSKRGETRQANTVDALTSLWESPTNQTGTKGTAFALYNTAVEYADWQKSTRCTDNRQENDCRFESSMFGSGADFKDNALVEALALV